MEKSYILSFLVPTLGARKKEIERLLKSLQKQTYQNLEVVFVVQDNYAQMEQICSSYKDSIDISLIKSEEKGLSKARNKGIPKCKGELIALSDDDCWYPETAAENIIKYFNENDISVLLTQIYDYDNSRVYKAYKTKQRKIDSSFSLLSKSSIEITFKRTEMFDFHFDELFGLGSHFVCGEEVDFLLNLFKHGFRMMYAPVVTVYHEKKYSGSTRNQVVAKGAIYAKNYNIVIGTMICIKDLILRRESNFKPFFEGYNEYKIYKRNY